MSKGETIGRSHALSVMDGDRLVTRAVYTTASECLIHESRWLEYYSGLGRPYTLVTERLKRRLDQRGTIIRRIQVEVKA